MTSTAVLLGTKKAKPFLINGPGEYEVAEVSIFGLPSGKKNTIYLIEIDDLKLAHLGGLDHLLDDKKTEELNGVDILLVPVGGTFTLDVKQAAKLTVKIQPKIVMPMHYQLPGLAYKLSAVDDFLKALGEEKIKPVDSLTVSRDRLPEERQLVIFNARN